MYNIEGFHITNRLLLEIGITNLLDKPFKDISMEDKEENSMNKMYVHQLQHNDTNEITYLFDNVNPPKEKNIPDNFLFIQCIGFVETDTVLDNKDYNSIIDNFWDFYNK